MLCSFYLSGVCHSVQWSSKRVGDGEDIQLWRELREGRNDFLQLVILVLEVVILCVEFDLGNDWQEYDQCIHSYTSVCVWVCEQNGAAGYWSSFLTLILLSNLLCVSLMCSSLCTVLTSKKAQTLSCSRRSHTWASSNSSSSTDSPQLLMSRVRYYNMFTVF